MTAYTLDLNRANVPGTVERYKSAFALFGRFLEATHDELVTVDMFTRDMLGEFYDWLLVGLHRKARGLYTKKRIVNKVESAWAWAFNTEWHSAVPRPKTIEMRKQPKNAPVSPTFAEMAACVDACVSIGPRRLATILYYTGVRTSQAQAFTWDDVDVERGLLTVPPHKALPGRIIPLSPYFVAELATWGRREGLLCGWSVNHTIAERRLNEAWARAKVREAVWKRAPGKAFRKGLTSGLKQLGANEETAELYVGRGVAGARARYLDLGHVPFAPIAEMIPSLASVRVAQLKLSGVG